MNYCMRYIRYQALQETLSPSYRCASVCYVTLTQHRVSFVALLFGRFTTEVIITN
jgi:hypothetical protein